MKNVDHFFVAAVVLAVLMLPAWSGETAATAPLGSAVYVPSVDRPIGWRGDGSGRYPAATPPTVWARTKSGGGYSVKNVLWATPLPNIGVSTPIIVGNRIFLTTEVDDMVCLDKATGRILWIRSSAEFEGMKAEDPKAEPEPAFKEKLAPLMEQLAKANVEVADALNAQLDKAATTQVRPVAAQNKKRELEKKIQTEQLAIDKKKFERYWGQAVFGFAGQTPVSDGKHVCAFYTTGVTVCYDLDGNRKWIESGRGNGAEHGNFASPILCGNVLAVWAHEMRGYDVETGKLLWKNPARGNNNYGSMFRVQVGNELVAGFQYGYFTRAKDGKPVWDQGLFGDSVMTPIVENGVIYATVGYPKNNNEATGFRSFKVPPSADAGKLIPGVTFKTTWAADEVPVEKDKKPFERGYVASALFVDGLIYRMTEGGGLIVNDAASGEIVYRKAMPMKPRTHYWDWAGASVSPTLAGKYIYLMDNQGTTIVIQPGKEYKEVAKNMFEESLDGKEQDQNLACPVFEGTRMYYRTPLCLYCIGEK